MNHIRIIDNWYCVYMYYRLHPGVLLPLNFCSTDIHTIWVIDDVALSHSRAFGWQCMVRRSFYYVLVNIPWLPHLFLSSSFSSISMMHHKQCQITDPCAWAMYGELCSWIYGWTRYDGCYSARFVMSTDCSFCDTYDITHFNFMSIFCH